MFCKYCGKEISKDSKFCSKCGVIVSNNKTEDGNNFDIKEEDNGNSISCRVCGITIGSFEKKMSQLCN